MGYYFVVVGLIGAPFTNGLSLALGLIACVIAIAGNHAEGKTRRRIRAARTIGGTIWWMIVGMVAAVCLLLLFGSALFALLATWPQ